MKRLISTVIGLFRLILVSLELTLSLSVGAAILNGTQ